jgi:hypothetical protein
MILNNENRIKIICILVDFGIVDLDSLFVVV